MNKIETGVAKKSLKAEDTTKQQTNVDVNKDFLFEKENYRLLFISLGFIVVGCILMVGGRSDSTDFFNYEMFNFQRLTLSPILLIIGYALGIFAIMKKPKKSDNQK